MHDVQRAQRVLRTPYYNLQKSWTVHLLDKSDLSYSFSIHYWRNKTLLHFGTVSAVKIWTGRLNARSGLLLRPVARNLYFEKAFSNHEKVLKQRKQVPSRKNSQKTERNHNTDANLNTNLLLPTGPTHRQNLVSSIYCATQLDKRF